MVTDEITPTEVIEEHPAVGRTLTVKATVTEQGETRERVVEVPFTPGDSLEVAINLYGKELVYSLYRLAASASVEAETRRLLRGHPRSKPLSDEEIKRRMSYYRLGTDGAAREKTLRAIAQIIDPHIRQAALQAAGAVEEELPKPREAAEPTNGTPSPKAAKAGKGGKQ
jgi:hypothetical protein